MKLLNLEIKNIGPFIEGNIEFATFENSKKQVTIITGENGTGKTIILDTIRKMFLGERDYSNVVKRDIIRENGFFIKMDLIKDQNSVISLSSSQIAPKGIIINQGEDVFPFYDIPNALYHKNGSKNNLWIVNYWTSQNDNEPFNIVNLDFLKPEEYLVGSLNGIQKNAETTKIITFFDYYKSSEQSNQKKEGEFIYETIKKIFKMSLNEGELKYVDRTTLMPIVDINGNDISLEKLSSGNLYLVQRMLGLLSQMYSVYKLNDLKLEDMLQTSGVLLIDEAENHLHPKWQKTFLNSILEIFPNLQIIATTHSPFIVGSVDGTKVYVCKSFENHSKIIDETSFYANKPINEILVSEVFAETQPFASKEISDLLEKRELAIKEGNKTLENQIEAQLLEMNPEYFSYFNIDNLIKKIQNQ